MRLCLQLIGGPVCTNGVPTADGLTACVVLYFLAPEILARCGNLISAVVVVLTIVYRPIIVTG